MKYPLLPLALLGLALGACKKESAAEDGSSDADAPAKARTRVADRDLPENRGRRPMEGPPGWELVRATEEARLALQRSGGQTSGAEMEAHLAESIGDQAMMEKAKEKIAALAEETAAAERKHAEALAAVRKRKEDDPQDKAVSAYVAYLDQIASFQSKRDEATDARKAGDPEAAEASVEELKEEAAKLRELRAAWEAEMPEKE